jgi:hypothetical protein
MTRPEAVKALQNSIISLMQEHCLGGSDTISFYALLQNSDTFTIADALECLRELENAGTRSYEQQVAISRAQKILCGEEP